MQQWWRNFYCFFVELRLRRGAGHERARLGPRGRLRGRGGELTFDSAGYHWLKANAWRFGFVHPAWAEPGRVVTEPWHWEQP